MAHQISVQSSIRGGGMLPRMPVTTIIFTILGRVILPKTHMEPEDDTFQVWNFRFHFQLSAFWRTYQLLYLISMFHWHLGWRITSRHTFQVLHLPGAWAKSWHEPWAPAVPRNYTSQVHWWRVWRKKMHIRNPVRHTYYVRYGVFFGR